MTILQQVKEANGTWFSPQNKKFFNDRQYWVRYGKISGERFLVRSTYAWTDMFDQPRILHYIINPIKDDLTIVNLIDDVFKSMDSVNLWLRLH